MTKTLIAVAAAGCLVLSLGAANAGVPGSKQSGGTSMGSKSYGTSKSYGGSKSYGHKTVIEHCGNSGYGEGSASSYKPVKVEFKPEHKSSKHEYKPEHKYEHKSEKHEYKPEHKREHKYSKHEEKHEHKSEHKHEHKVVKHEDKEMPVRQPASM